MAQFSPYDFFAANPSMGSPYEGGFNGGDAWTAFHTETGSGAGFDSPEYRQWAMSKIAPGTLSGFQNAPADSNIRMLPNGQMEVADKILSSNMNKDGFLGFDWGEMMGPGLLLGAPFAGMMGAFGGLGGLGGAAGAGTGASEAAALTGSGGFGSGFGSIGAGGAGGLSLSDLSKFFPNSGGDASWGVNPQSGGSVSGVDSSGFSLNEAGEWVPDVTSTSASTYLPNGMNLPFDYSKIPGLSQLLNNSGSTGASSLLKSILGSTGGLGGAALGALLGGLGANQKPAGNITTTQDIPDYLKPYQSMNLTSGMNNFGLASSGQSLLPGAQGYMQDQINGKYLDPNTNPAFQPYVKDLMGQAGSQFAARYGATPEALNNTGNQEGFTRAITAAALPLYNSAYQTAQSNQYNAAQNAPSFANNVAGAALAPNLAFKNLYTGPQTNTTPYFTNPTGGALSGALAGGMLGSQLGR